MSNPSAPAARWLPPVAADLVCVLVFAMAGKASHEASRSDWVVLAIVWPYALSVALVHAALLAGGRPPRRVWPEGVAVLAVTFLLGTRLRVMSGRGIAAGFLAVTAVFLALTMPGWRTILLLATRRRASHPT